MILTVKPGSWPSILITYVFGVLGIAALVNFVPLAADLHRDVGATAAQHAWLISLFALPAAVLSIASGTVIDRVGPRTILLVGAAAGALADFTYLGLNSIQLFQAVRLFEGIGLVCIFTAGPAFLMGTTEGKRRILAMTVWSTFAPIGSMLGLAVSGHFAGTPHWRYGLLIHGSLLALAALAGLLLPNPRQATHLAPSGLKGAIRRAIAAFAEIPLLSLAGVQFLLSILTVGMTAVAPNALVRWRGLSIAQASGLVASTNLAMLIGSFGVGALLARGLTGRVLYPVLAVLAAGATFLVYAPGTPLGLITAALCVWYAASGACTAAILATMARLAHAERRGAAAGVMSQASSLGNLIGPPIWLALFAQGHWLPLPLLVTIAFAMASALFWSLRLPAEPPLTPVAAAASVQRAA